MTVKTKTIEKNGLKHKPEYSSDGKLEWVDSNGKVQFPYFSRADFQRMCSTDEEKKHALSYYYRYQAALCEERITAIQKRRENLMQKSKDVLKTKTKAEILQDKIQAQKDKLKKMEQELAAEVKG